MKQRLLKRKGNKKAHAFKTYAHTCNVEILNSFNPELQLKKTGSAIRYKLISLLNELKGFKFVIILILKLKRK